jgi:GNAT superfamily N-acetyltransferase
MTAGRFIRRSVRIVGERLYRRLLLVARPLGEPDPTIDASVSLAFGRLARSDSAEYLAFHPGEAIAEIERRFDRGDLCFLARSEGRIVGAVWTTRASPAVRYLHTTLAIAPDDVYLYDAYTAPDLRGRRIAPTLYRDVLTHHRAAGVRRAIAAILPENRATMRSLAEAGFRVIGRVGYVQLGPWRRYFGRDAGHDRDRDDR